MVTEAEARRARIARLLDVAVAAQIGWITVHHVGLSWCVEGGGVYGAPLPFMEWAGSSLDWTYSPLPLLADWVAQSLPVAVALRVVGRRVRPLWPRIGGVVLLSPLVLFTTLKATLFFQDADLFPRMRPLHGVRAWAGTQPPYTDPRCPGPRG